MSGPQTCEICGSTDPTIHNANLNRQIMLEGYCHDPFHSSNHDGREVMNKLIGHAHADQFAGWCDIPVPCVNKIGHGIRHEKRDDCARACVISERGDLCVNSRRRRHAERPDCALAGAYVSTSPDPEQSKTVQKWADQAMFTAQPIDAQAGPQVRLLWMTPDPLGAIAAACMGYEGRFVDDLSEITDEERLHYFAEVQKTHLKAPFEFVQFHFSISGVTRGFTHQMVRQRMATYVQESTRFAVKEDMPVDLPPSLSSTTGVWRDHERDALNQLNGFADHEEYDAGDFAVERLVADYMVRESEAERQRWAWDQAVDGINSKYQYLVNSGVPAEDARGLLPTNLLTRIQYRTDLRSLIEHGGNRLCTQAQFEWRTVFSKIVEAIRAAEHPSTAPTVTMHFKNNTPKNAVERHPIHMASRIADVFRPVCYLTGKCEFGASFDRKCTIRNRVDANHEIGRASGQWAEEHDAVEGSPLVCGVGPTSVVREQSGRPVFIGAIKPAEWLLNPGAAR